jgi:methylaspartate mutase sigma subunit
VTEPAIPGRTVVLSSVASDAHTWNLVYLQLLLEENGHRVINLGACVPVDVLLLRCREHRPDALVISTVNGHGHVDGRELIAALRADPELGALPAVIGGKLGVDGDDAGRAAELAAAGFDAVFADGTGTAGFVGLIGSLARPALAGAS